MHLAIEPREHNLHERHQNIQSSFVLVPISVCFPFVAPFVLIRLQYLLLNGATLDLVGHSVPPLSFG